MKKAIGFLSFLFLFNFSFSQESTIKNYPLKDYVAPDIKYRMFDLGSGLVSGGGIFGSSSADRYANGFQVNALLNYFEYINISRYQGISDAGFRTDFSTSNSKKDSINLAYNNLSIDLNYSTQNRIYFQNNIFFGIHGNLFYEASPLNSNSGEYNYKEQRHYFSITPYISVGKGRVQPIESARRAMDILISLAKYNRLAIVPDTSMIDSLARVANRIRFKRFYDSRFKTIYQLEELDKAIQNLGLVDSADIVYFANLNDIWNYAPTFLRGSGTRFEGGIIPHFGFNFIKQDDIDRSELIKDKLKNYGFYGFFSFNRIRPVSYAWQSNLMIDLTIGYNEFINNYERNDVKTESGTNSLKGLLNASWQFGYFPNTRTYAGITPYVGFSNNYSLEYKSYTFGVITGLRFDMYYYVSPRLRLSFNASVSYGENFDFLVPTPFWNTVSYNHEARKILDQTNDMIAFPIESSNFFYKTIVYSGSVSLTYAIF
jgi:hypothetical protein